MSNSLIGWVCFSTQPKSSRPGAKQAGAHGANAPELEFVLLWILLDSTLVHLTVECSSVERSCPMAFLAVKKRAKGG